MIKKTVAVFVAFATGLVLLTAYILNSLRMLDDFDFGDDD
jgi:hypothetical protein